MSEHHKSSLEYHKSRLRDSGYKLTHARLTVLDVIQNLGGHCTSADVLDAVGTIDESIGRASVFRTLDLLTQLGIVRPTYVDTSMTPQYFFMVIKCWLKVIYEMAKIINFTHMIVQSFIISYCVIVVS